MATPLNILIIEDNIDDADLILHELRLGGFDITSAVVEGEQAMRSQLAMPVEWDVVLSDYNLPAFDVGKALEIANELSPLTPFIIISGSVSTEKAVWLMRRGAVDFIAKDDLARLIPALQRELKETKIRNARIQAEQSLRDSEDKYRKVFDNVRIGMSLVDLQGNFQHVNREMLNIFGYSYNVFLTKSVKSLTHPDDLEETSNYWKQVLRGEDDVGEIEERYIHKDGHIVWGALSRVIIRDDTGKPEYIMAHLQDVTARKMAEEAQLESEKNYRFLFNSANDAIFVTDPETKKILDVNDEAVKRLGYSRDELLGMKVPQLYSPNSGQFLKDSFKKLAEEGSLVAESRHFRKDGSYLPVEVSVSQTTYGGRRCYQAYARDITDRKQAEKALRDSEKKFRDFASASADLFWETDENHHITYHSRVDSEMPDDGVEDIIGFRRRERTGTKEDDENWRRHMADMDAQRPFRDFRFIRTDNDGDQRHLRLNGMPVFNEDGEFLGYRGTIVDESAEVKAQLRAADARQRFLDAVEASAEGFSYWDSSDSLIICNSQFRLFFADVAEFLVRGIDYERFITKLAESIEENQTKEQAKEWVEKRMQEYRAPTSSAEIVCNGRWYENRKQRMEDGSHISFMSDITHRRVAEQSARQAEKMEALGNLAGGIAHDFNNMLLPIVALTEMTLRQLPEDTPHSNRLSRVIQAAERAKNLVNRILSFSRQDEPKREIVDICSVINNSLDLLSSTLPSTIKITSNCTDRPPILVSADTTQVGMIIMNLANNAAHAMDGKPGQLEVDISSFDICDGNVNEYTGLKKGRYAHIKVRDTGYGMDRETMDQIFNPFFTTKEVGEGTGLGLSVVHGIVSKHDGAINVASELGNGTTFDLYFPTAE